MLDKSLELPCGEKKYLGSKHAYLFEIINLSIKQSVQFILFGLLLMVS